MEVSVVLVVVTGQYQIRAPITELEVARGARCLFVLYGHICQSQVGDCVLRQAFFYCGRIRVGGTCACWR